MKFSLVAAGLLSGALAKECTVPEDTKGADDGNPHCWTRARRCDGPNAHPTGGPGYDPPCGVCEGVGGIPWGDDANDIDIPACTKIATADEVNPKPKLPKWAIGSGKFTIKNDRFIMIGKKQDPFCFKFFPSNNSVGNQCYRRQFGTLYYDMTSEQKSIRYDLNIHIPWPSDKHSLFGNVSSTIFHHGPDMWIINDLPLGIKQVICTQPLSASDPHAKHNTKPIYPVMYNWTNHMSYVGREEFVVEYGVGKMQLDHFTYGPHHAWTKVGDDTIVRMWQPYNGFEVFAPGSWTDGVADPKVFENMAPPALAKKGGSMIRIGCDDNGFPKKKSEESEFTEKEPATADDLKRSRTKIPRKSHKGSHFEDMSGKLNGFLKRYSNTKECNEWKVEELQQFQALMLMMRSPELDSVYSGTSDRRAMRGDEQAHGERWERLTQLASRLGGKDQVMHRDGHCHEAVMWFVHHVSEPTRQKLAAMLAVPLLPYNKHSCTAGDDLCDEYLAQVSCQDCHAESTAPTNNVVV
jgi:hypothetical protein